jgi:hypothetical protein
MERQGGHRYAAYVNQGNRRTKGVRIACSVTETTALGCGNNTPSHLQLLTFRFGFFN